MLRDDNENGLIYIFLSLLFFTFGLLRGVNWILLGIGLADLCVGLYLMWNHYRGHR